MTDGLHLLRLAEAGFELDSLSNIFRRGCQEYEEGAGGVADRTTAHPHLDGVAGAAEPGGFEALDGIPLDQAVAQVFEAGGRTEDQGHVALQQVGFGARLVTQHVGHGAIGLQKLAAEGGAADGVRGLLNQQPVTLFGEPQGAIGHGAAGAIESYPDDPNDAAIGTEQRLHVSLEFMRADDRGKRTALALQRQAVGFERLRLIISAGEERVEGLAGRIAGGKAQRFQSGSAYSGEAGFEIGRPDYRGNLLEEQEQRVDGGESGWFRFLGAGIS